MNTIVDLFAKGGIVMGFIFCLSIYVTAVILFKFYQFYRMQTLNPLFIEQVESSLDRQALKQRLMNAHLEMNPVAKVMLAALTSLDRALQRDPIPVDLVKEEIARVGGVEIRYLESHLRGLEMAANVAPLLGLFGTVTGIVETFSSIEQAGSRVDPSLLAGGIWTALLTTVAGLAVAIVAVIAHHCFNEQIEKIRATMKDMAVRLLFNSEMGAGQKETSELLSPSSASAPPLASLRRQANV